MSFRIRAASLLTLLALAGAGQFLLERHVESAGTIGAAPLAHPLADLPLQIGPWQGQDVAVEDPRLQLGDARSRRLYRRSPSDRPIEVWIVHARDGSDRYHHPEICMAVAGRQEDPAGRDAFWLPGHSAPVQQYRFGSLGRRQLVFYWYYTLFPAPDDELDSLQRLYQRLHQRPASMTIEVFAPEQRAGDGDQAREFVRRLDAELQSILPATAVRGRQRAPITVIDE